MRSPVIATVALSVLLLAGCQTARLQRDAINAAQTRAALAQIHESPALDEMVAAACRATVAAHQGDLESTDHIWAAVIDLTQPDQPLLGQWHGNELVYPASVIKTVYMAHAYQQVVNEQLELNRNLKRLLREMIRVSSNVATQDIVDLLSDTINGPRIDDPAAYALWCERRNSTNRYMRSLGFTRMNANQKTWDDLPAADSREIQFLGADHYMGYANGNRLTAVETAELMWLITSDNIVSPRACRAMRDLLRRRGSERRYGDAHRAIAQSIHGSFKVWSKGGSTDRFYHDASVIEFPDGDTYVMVVFTILPWREGINRDEILGTWAEELLYRLR